MHLSRKPMCYDSLDKITDTFEIKMPDFFHEAFAVHGLIAKCQYLLYQLH